MAMSRQADDNLPEVVPDPSPQALSQAELYARHGLEGGEGKYPYPYHDGKEYAPPGHGLDLHKEVVSPLSPDVPTLGEGAGLPSSSPPPPPPPRICGVNRRTFWILLAVAGAVVIAVAVGAGVGATRGGGGGGDAQEQAPEPSATSSVESSAVPTVTSPTDISSSAPSSASSASSASSTTTSTEPTPTIPAFLNETQVLPIGTYAFQAFSEVNYTGNYTEVYKDEGVFDFPFEVVSYIWLRNRTDCCINFCEGPDHFTGYRCDPRMQPNASDPFPRLYIGCGVTAPRGTQNRFCSPR